MVNMLGVGQLVGKMDEKVGWLESISRLER